MPEPPGAPARGGKEFSGRLMPALSRIYARPLAVGWAEIPRAEPGTHTMGGALEEYVRQRIPGRLFCYAAAQGIGVEVHGIYPAHVSTVLPGAVLVDSGRRFSGKRFNHVRPHYFLVPGGTQASRQDGGRLVVAVPPGRDYVLHYASLAHHFLASHGASTAGATGAGGGAGAADGAPTGSDAETAGSVSAFRYPAAEATIASWTHLAEFVEPGDRLLLGYVQELVPLLVSAGAVVCAQAGNDYYGSIRMRFPRSGALVNALGVRFSFWGDISARLVEACAARGATEIIYSGKLGALTTPADIYGKIFLPSSYVNYGRGSEPERPWPGPPNGLLDFYPYLDSGTHMSVGTVLEEDLVQRALADRLKVNSIDNEISQMADALASAAGDGPTAFSALHFATDYLNGHGTRASASFHNLATNRRADALHLKQRILNDIAVLLRSYYDGEPPPLESRVQQNSRHDSAAPAGQGMDIGHESVLVDGWNGHIAHRAGVQQFRQTM